jgi:hypothetical protein
MRKTSFTTTLGPNVYTLSCAVTTANKCSFAALNVRNSAVKAITIFQAGSDGSKATDWAQNNSFPTDPTTSMSVYLPDLIIFGEIGNSIVPTQISIPAYTTALTTIVTASKAAVSGVSGKSTDVLFNTTVPFAQDGTPLTASQYQAAVAAVGAAQGVPVFDSMAALGGTTAGWFLWGPHAGTGCCGSQDVAHWSVGAQAYLAALYAQILTQ